MKKVEEEPLYEALYERLVNEAVRQTTAEEGDVNAATSMAYNWRRNEDFAVNTIEVGTLSTMEVEETTLKGLTSAFLNNGWSLEDIAYVRFSPAMSSGGYYHKDYRFLLVSLKNGKWFRLFIQTINPNKMNKEEYEEYEKIKEVIVSSMDLVRYSVKKKKQRRQHRKVKVDNSTRDG